MRCLFDMANYIEDRVVGYADLGKASKEHMRCNDVVDFSLHSGMQANYDVELTPRGGEYDPMQEPNRHFDVEKGESLAFAIEAEFNEFGVPDKVQVIDGEGIFRVYWR